MKVFKLPDLGEGLPDAEIHEWHVKEGETVKLDQPMVAMETAKALVDVPAPRSGTIAKLHGKPGDIIKTHAPLVEFTDGEDEASHHSASAATVAGNIEIGNTIIQDETSSVTPKASSKSRVQVIPALRALAKRLGVDLTDLSGTGPNGRITAEDIKQNAGQQSPTTPVTPTISGTVEALRGPRRQMINSMISAHQNIVPTTIFDDADIHAWPKDTDFTVRVIQAIVAACGQVPSLNAHFDAQSLSRTLADSVNIGLALDSTDGLFVPVIHHAEKASATELRECINRYKTQVNDRSIASSDLQGSTITLSNFGVFAGRYATPVITPPMVAIIAIGKLRQEPTVYQNQIVSHPILPVSLTFDHRAVTGGEASRFLGALITQLSQ